MRRAPRTSEAQLVLVFDARFLRPRTRRQCVDGPRPCPWVGCRHHLWLEAALEGCERWEDGECETCALDVAAMGGLDRGQVAEVMGVGMAEVAVVELRAIGAVRAAMGMAEPSRLGKGRDAVVLCCWCGNVISRKRRALGARYCGDSCAGEARRTYMRERARRRRANEPHAL